MIDFLVEKLTFSFPDGWQVQKYDDSVFYKEHFVRILDSISAVDLIAVAPNKVAYLIEVKDYRLATDSGPKDLPNVVARKVLYTLAAQIPCRLMANSEAERTIAALVCECKALVIVLHLEEPTVPNGIFRPYKAADLLQKLRQILRPIHARPWVLNRSRLGDASWTVQ